MAADHITDMAALPPPDHNSLIYVLGHLVAGGAVIGALVGALPALSALGVLIWYCIQIWETKTVQGWLHRRKARHAKRRQRAAPAKRTTRARSKATSRKR